MILLGGMVHNYEARALSTRLSTPNCCAHFAGVFCEGTMDLFSIMRRGGEACNSVSGLNSGI